MTAEAMIEVEAAVGLATGTAAEAGVKTVTAGRCEVTRQTQRGVKGCETGASNSRDRAEQYQQREEEVLRDRPKNLDTEAALIIAGFGIAPRAQSGAVMHLCANCCWLDDALRQPVRAMARQHSMAF